MTLQGPTRPTPVAGKFSPPLLRWYRRHRRDLPWRATPPNPYHVLVSEFMLQQTQVATVVPYFLRFIKQFPSPGKLATASQQQVLRLWQGLGYYSRARNLHAAARAIVAEHGGRIPRDVDALLTLPGVGRYTAGAIASIAFGKREPILDGNVMRVLCRLDGIRTDPREPQTNRRLWKRAREILPSKGVGDFNSALMELGATICTPRNPQCEVCPLSRRCKARALEVQEKIPPRRKARATPLNRRWTFAVAHRGRWLITQRPPAGRWASLWQFVTVPANGPMHDASVLLGFPVSDVRPLGEVRRTLTHRRYHFGVFACRAAERPAGTWVTLAELSRYPLSKPQLDIARLLAAGVESLP
jgi:A/G-specific adenine glycosylase